MTVINLPLNVENTHQINKEQTSPDVRVPNSDYNSTIPNTELQPLSFNLDMKTSSEGSVSLPVLTVKNNPVIRKAKNIRTDTQNQNIPLDIPKTILSSKPHYDTKTEYINYAQPPPYHIAAARSQYFNSLDCNECVNLTTQKTPDDAIITNVNYSKYLIKKTYSDVSNFAHEQVSLTSDIQNLNLDKTNYNNLSSYYEDIKTEYTQYNTLCNNIQNQDYKPRTFIQDKPTPSEYIVAPTPKRPVSSDSTGLQLYKETNNGNIQFTTNGHGSVDDKSVHEYQEAEQKSTSENSPSATSNSSVRWAFGPHKNATVIQVTIQKSPQLGFTISQKQGYVS